jgi:hypothetical protein
MARCIVDVPCLCLLVAAAAGGQFWPAITSGNPSHAVRDLTTFDRYFRAAEQGREVMECRYRRQRKPYLGCFIYNDKTLCGVVHSAHPHNGLRPNQAQAASPMVWG